MADYAAAAAVDDPRVERLLEEILESGDRPEEVCRTCPELLPQVHAGLAELRRLQEQIGPKARARAAIS